MYIGIDVGTSNVKAVLVDERQAILAEESRQLETLRKKPEDAEQNPEDWLTATEAALLELKGKAPAPYATTRAISLSGQMHGLVALGADQKPVRPCILWNDPRAVGEASEIERRFSELSNRTGVLCMASFIAPKWLWLQRNEPQTITATRHVLMPKDYVRLHLTGALNSCPVDGAGSWLMDEETRDWSPAVLSAIGLDLALLPTIRESEEVAGTLRPALADQLGLPKSCQVVIGAGDAACGSIGLGQINESDAFISLGTSSQLFVTTARYRPSVKTLVHAFAHGLPGRWFQMAAMLNGASALAWWASICGADAGALEQDVAQSSPEPGPLFLPYLAGERTPHNNPQASGTFHGLKPGTNRSQMTRAVLEGVAFTLADARQALEASGTIIGTVGFTGGGAKSAVWAQMIADAIDRTVIRYADAAVGPAFGAARLARIGTSGESAAAVATKPAIIDQFEPKTNVSQRLADWRGLYRAISAH
jgi:xylulokinase